MRKSGSTCWLHPYVFAGRSRTQVSTALITLARLTSCCFIVHANLCLKLDCQNFFVSSECSCRVTQVPAVLDQKSAREKCTEDSFVDGSNQTTPIQQRRTAMHHPRDDFFAFVSSRSTIKVHVMCWWHVHICPLSILMETIGTQHMSIEIESQTSANLLHTRRIELIMSKRPSKAKAGTKQETAQQCQLKIMRSTRQRTSVKTDNDLHNKQQDAPVRRTRTNQSRENTKLQMTPIPFLFGHPFVFCLVHGRTTISKKKPHASDDSATLRNKSVHRVFTSKKIRELFCTQQKPHAHAPSRHRHQVSRSISHSLPRSDGRTVCLASNQRPASSIQQRRSSDMCMKSEPPDWQSCCTLDRAG